MKAQRKTSRPQGRHVGIASLLGLMVALSGFYTGHSQTSDIVCPITGAFCSANEQCMDCIVALESFPSSDTSTHSDSLECPILYADACSVVQTTDCNVTNPEFVDLVKCLAEELYDCTGFTSCEDAFSAALSTPAPGAVSGGMATFAPTAVVETSVAPAMSTESPAEATPGPLGTDDAEEATGSSNGFKSTAAMAATLGLVSGMALVLAM